MNAEGILHDAKLGDLLEAGDEALALGEARAAHDIWRVAAVANPYDERVWLALLRVLEDEEDRKVCLKNIIAINPLNTEARRQLRLLLRAEHKREEAVQTAQMAVVTPLPRPATKPRRSAARTILRALLTGIGIGVFAVVLGIIVSVVVYGGILAIVAP